MAKYTMELRNLVKAGYPIFDGRETWDTFVPEHRQVLCDKIVKHYWFYEIGQETADRFKFNLNEHLALIMPYYNQLYMSELLKFEPLFDTYFTQDTENSVIAKNVRSNAKASNETRLRNIANAMKRLEQLNSNVETSGANSSNETWDESGSKTTIKTGEENGEYSKTTNETVTGEDTTNKTTSNTMTGKDTTNKTTKDVTEAKDTISGKEDTTDKITGNKETETNSTTTGSATRRYSDTPQGIISTAGNLSIDNHYLTNYTSDSNNGTTHATGTEDETRNETKSTTKTETVDKKSTVNGTEQTTVDKSQTDNGTDTTTVNKSQTTNGTENGTDSKNTEENEKETYSKDGSKEQSGKDSSKEDRKESGEQNEFSNGSDDTHAKKTDYENEQIDNKSDTKGKNATYGYTVSPAELLMKYRQTFINVDRMIIEELATDFMGVF